MHTSVHRPTVDDVRDRLAGCATVTEMAEALMDLALDRGMELPSLYLERGGRLRCVAQRGYWQVYDGLAPGAGVLGTTYALGRTQQVHDPGVRPDFIRAIPAVCAEVAVPVLVDGTTVGVFNVESRSPLDADDVSWVEAVGTVVGRRIAELGGPPQEEPAERLARFGYELATLEDRDRIVRHTLVAAVTVSGLRGACVFLAVEGGGWAAAGDSGRIGRVLGALPPAAVDQLADYVAQATSSWADGTAGGESFEATGLLREHGVGSLVVLALVANGRREGLLVLADDRPHPKLGQVIPLLELLASTAAAMVVSAETSAALQRSERLLAHQARHDPLTGVANRSNLLEQMRAAMADDVVRAGLVALFVDLDGFKVVNDRHGHAVGDQLLVAVADRLRHAARGDDLVARLGGDEFVVLCRGITSLAEVAAISERILERLAEPFRVGGVEASITACVGAAAADGLSSAEHVLEAADRAMYAAKATGAGRVAVADALV